MTTNLATQVATLTGLIDKLSPRDQEFARSLCKQFAQRGFLSDKQAPWVAKLIANTQPRATVAVGQTTGIVALFAKARQHLKQPRVVLALENGREFRISVAGPKARVPGSLNVADVARFGEGDWYGRVHQDGRFEQSNRCEIPAGLVALLQRFAADPAGVAAEYGRLTGKCCFCNSPLKDERSTSVGYGPTCAENFGLPWGPKAVAKQAAEASQEPAQAAA